MPRIKPVCLSYLHASSAAYPRILLQLVAYDAILPGFVADLHTATHQDVFAESS